MDASLPLVIALAMPKLPAPEVSAEAAVVQALMYRLDLQTGRDQLDDARRQVLVAENALLPDLNLTGSATFPSNPNLSRGGAQLDSERGSYTAGVRLGLPFDREIEMLQARQSEIDLVRAIRAYDALRDTVAVSVRSAIRDIDRARFSLELQEENIRIAKRRQESIEAAPDRVNARDRSEALEEYLRALDDRDAARRDLQIAILRYLLETGQMRVDPDGTLRPIRGMPELESVPIESTTIQPYEEQAEEEGAAGPDANAPDAGQAPADDETPPEEEDDDDEPDEPANGAAGPGGRGSPEQIE
jgi:outer membrane protein TolC